MPSLRMPSVANANEQQTKRCAILDAKLVRKTREPGFNVYKTFENHLIQLINQLITFAHKITVKNCMIGSPGYVTYPV